MNCTGLDGTLLAGDKTCYPIRGGLIRVINDGRDFPKVESALAITSDAVNDSNEMVLIVPRNDNILLIGTLLNPDVPSMSHNLTQYVTQVALLNRTSGNLASLWSRQ